MKTVADHPFISLVVEALNLTHPRFALAHGREYTSEEAAEPTAARKVRERPFLMEFYHEFRRLWDKAVPVQRGLGHVIIQADPEAGSRTPDLLFWQLGETRPARSTSRRGLNRIRLEPRRSGRGPDTPRAVSGIAWLSRDGERGRWEARGIAFGLGNCDT